MASARPSNRPRITAIAGHRSGRGRPARQPAQRPGMTTFGQQDEQGTRNGQPSGRAHERCPRCSGVSGTRLRSPRSPPASSDHHLDHPLPLLEVARASPCWLHNRPDLHDVPPGTTRDRRPTSGVKGSQVQIRSARSEIAGQARVGRRGRRFSRSESSGPLLMARRSDSLRWSVVAIRPRRSYEAEEGQSQTRRSSAQWCPGFSTASPRGAALPRRVPQ